MPNFLIRSTEPGNPRWQVRLADCDRHHAASVVEQLEIDPSVPAKLELLELEHLWDVPPSKPSRLRRWLGLG